MSTENNKQDFQWTDALVKEFVRFIQDDKMHMDFLYGSIRHEEGKPPHEALVEWFKKEKGEKRSPEYEILSFDGSKFTEEQVRAAAKFGEYDPNGIYVAYAIQHNFPIHSVKRLSDGEVFSVGETVQHVEGHYSVTITEFYQPPSERGEMWFYWSSFKETVKNLDNFKKQDSLISPPKAPLFTTEDGVDTYEGQDCWVAMQGVSGGWNLHNWGNVCKRGMKDGEKYFHFYSNAAAWLEAQTPKVLFTTEDGVDLYEGDGATIYGVCPKGTWETACRKASLISPSVSWKWFAIPYNRDRYILLNKPLLSVNEVLDIFREHEVFDELVGALKEKAHAKL